MTNIGQKRSLVETVQNVRLWFRNQAFVPLAAAQNDLFVSDFRFWISKRMKPGLSGFVPRLLKSDMQATRPRVRFRAPDW